VPSGIPAAAERLPEGLAWWAYAVGIPAHGKAETAASATRRLIEFNVFILASICR
jgi:hypothetical protein